MVSRRLWRAQTPLPPLPPGRHGLRSWPLARYPYPYLVFYIERDDHIDVWRLLHGLRDMAAWLREDVQTENLGSSTATRQANT